VHWSAGSASGLIGAIDTAVRQANLHRATLQVEFVPPEFEIEMLQTGYRQAGEFVDAWIENLPSAHPLQPHRYPVRTMLSTEVMLAAGITQSCREQTRGFYGEEPSRIEQWISNPNQKVLFGLDGDRPVGVMLTGLYGFDHPRGTVCWIRELAVLPSFQKRGVGRELLLAGLQWGISHSAKRAFLSVDVQNEHAIRLYEKAGFVLRPGRGQINLQCDIP
jgi:ribosomal protein S18 acetylase RimI-like enzyme